MITTTPAPSARIPKAAPATRPRTLASPSLRLQHEADKRAATVRAFRAANGRAPTGADLGLEAIPRTRPTPTPQTEGAATVQGAVDARARRLRAAKAKAGRPLTKAEIREVLDAE